MANSMAIENGIERENDYYWIEPKQLKDAFRYLLTDFSVINNKLDRNARFELKESFRN